jgi:hypothetical protein
MPWQITLVSLFTHTRAVTGEIFAAPPALLATMRRATDDKLMLDLMLDLACISFFADFQC